MSDSPEFVDLSSYYDLGKLVLETDYCQVYEAVEKSISAPCLYHRIPVRDATSGQQWQAASVILKNYANLLHPRTPRLADAWFQQDCCVAVDYRTRADELSMESNNPLRSASGSTKAHLIESTLDLLAAVHSCSIVHGQITPKTFGMGRLDKVYLLDTGLDLSLARSFSILDMAEGLILSTNLYTRDLACWAFHILSLMCGEAFMPYSVDEKWDDFHFKKAGNRIAGIVRKPALVEFFANCLCGFGGGPIRFDTAGDALANWQKNDLRSQFQ